VLSDSKIAITKSVPEFEVTLIILIISLSIVFLLSKNVSQLTSLNFKNSY